MPGSSRREVGAANPRALAELRAGRTIDWSRRGFLEDASEVARHAGGASGGPEVRLAGLPAIIGGRLCGSGQM
jgi:hypothetical protein